MERRLDSLGVVLLAAWAIAPAALAGARTTVSLAGPDDTPKLGRPGITVHVHGPSPDDVAVVDDEMQRDLGRNAFTRPLAVGETGDYDLDVAMGTWQPQGEGRVLRFEAVLTSSTGRRLWHVDGRTETDTVPIERSVLLGVSRNVLAALLHDGWVQPRLDPNDPPPPPPFVRFEGGIPVTERP